MKKKKLPLTPKRRALLEAGSKPQLVDTVTGGAVMLSQNIESLVKQGLSAAVDAEIISMHHQNYWLPPLWHDLSAAIERLAQDNYGTTMNQRLMKRAHIERVEELCRAIGAGGTYFADKPKTH